MLSLFDFLTKNFPTSSLTGAARVSEILAELQQLEAQDQTFQETLAAYAEQREALLADPTVTDAQVASFDLTADRTHLARERLHAYQANLNAELDFLQASLAEQAFRTNFDARQAALVALSAAITNATVALQNVIDAHMTFDVAARGAGRRVEHWGDGGPLVVDANFASAFSARVASIEAAETARRANV